jgi:hypothetical protein
MDLIDLLALAIAAYVSVPLASLAMRKSWPDGLRFVTALALSFGIAAAELAISGTTFTRDAVMAGAGTAFIAQQATWHLKLPGLGSADLNEKLLEVPVLPG